MRRAARTDNNHREIIDELRQLGFSVADTSRLGGGFPDIVVGKNGVNYLMEIKDGDKPPSQRKLTPDEEKFFALWKGDAVVVNSIEEALRAVRNNA
jgi:Holliday junction resolvase